MLKGRFIGANLEGPSLTADRARLNYVACPAKFCVFCLKSLGKRFQRGLQGQIVFFCLRARL